MRIAINGAGVAGPALAWWLKNYGFEPVLFERAPELRTGGYMIDFWGAGYRIAERMGILPKLRELGYLIEHLRVVDSSGAQIAGMKTADLRELLGDRFLSIPRGDLSATIFLACGDIQTRFGTHIVRVEELADGIRAQLSDGTADTFDLIIGADGVHSDIRALVFGEDARFECDLQACVAAFTLRGYQPRDELVYLTHAMSKKMAGRCSLRHDQTLFLFTFRSELVKQRPRNAEEEKALLRAVFSDMKWEVPVILSRLDEAEDFYFDHVSQIQMEKWCKGRVGLIGDAAACVSLFAGEGTSLALVEAYVLAGELAAAKGDYQVAFRRYEEILQPFLIKKQKMALQTRAFFAPKNSWDLFVSRLFLRGSSIPVLSKYLLGSMLKDEIDLPDYSASV